MDLTKLFQMQKKLDERIVEEKGLEGQNLLDKKILSLQVELGELANEWRGFKFWSEDQESRRKKREKCPVCNGNGIVPMGEGVKGVKVCPYCDNYRGGIKTTYPLLEEYVDCLHFILSIGLECFPEAVNYQYFERTKNKTIVEQFIFITTKVGTLLINKSYTNYFHIVNNFLGLGEMLGFTWEQIKQSYYEKNRINHERQNNGY